MIELGLNFGIDHRRSVTGRTHRLIQGGGYGREESESVKSWGYVGGSSGDPGVWSVSLYRRHTDSHPVIGLIYLGVFRGVLGSIGVG